MVQATFSADGRRVVTASGDKSARVWDAGTGQPLSPPLRHEREVTGASLSPDGRRVLTASNDKTARVWDVSAEEMDLQDLLLLTQVLSGLRIDGTGGSASADIQEASWRQLLQRHPEAFRPSPVGDGKGE
jgi:WD40 repeat protein